MTERRPASWLTQQEYLETRKTVVNKQRAVISSFLEERSDLFGDLTEEQRSLGAELVAIFIFGLYATYKRFGFKYENYKITFDTGNEVEYDLLAYWLNGDSFGIKIDKFKDLLHGMTDPNLINVSMSGGGLRENIPVRDYWEIAGVEEAAHLIFFKEKSRGRKALETGSELDYYTSEPERRALVWKLAYTKRYFPQYADQLRKTLQEVNELLATTENTADIISS